MIKQNHGFSLLELLTAMGIIAILSHMGVVAYMDFMNRSSDMVAMSDTRNLMTVATEQFISGSYPDFSHGPGEGSNVGLKPDGTYAFTLSGGVKAEIIGLPSDTGRGYMEANVYHERGTPANSDYGRRVFKCVVDEQFNVSIAPSF